MEVADEVNYKSQCVSPRLSARIGIVEYGNLYGNGTRDATGRGRAILANGSLRCATGDIEEVPARGLGTNVSLIVGPSRGIREGIQTALVAVPTQIGTDWASVQYLRDRGA